jgi:hypothetical protein
MKQCKICLNLYSNESFYKSKKNNDGLQYYCKTCSNKKRIEYFKKNIKIELQTRKNYANKQKQKYIEYKKTLSCHNCNDNRWYVLDFHHKNDNKEFDVGNMGAGRFAWKTVLKEIEKCEVLCANCHREKHYKMKAN